MIKELLKTTVNRLLAPIGLRVYSTRAHGREDVQDILRTDTPIRIIVDAGANIGQSVEKFRAAFPEARIYAFEPVSSVYKRLLANTATLSQVECIHAALGSEVGSAKIHIRRHDTTHTLVEVGDAVAFEQVTVETINHFCANEKIPRIDLLKVDVEGFDLEVLKGSEELLHNHAIGFILVECGFTPGDGRHVLFDSIRDYLLPFGYQLFGIYDQQTEWDGEPRIRYANVCFALQTSGFNLV